MICVINSNLGALLRRRPNSYQRYCDLLAENRDFPRSAVF